MHRLRRLSLGLALFAAACGGSPASETTPAILVDGIPTTWELRGAATSATADRGMVVSGHPLASDVGANVLRAGGNAIDAAVAVGFALAAVLPSAGNIGGGGFLVHRDRGGEVRTLDYRERAPAAASPDMYVDANGVLTDDGVIGHRAAGVPGSVAGLWAMHQELGSLPWRDLVEPAIALARGHVIDSTRHAAIEAAREELARYDASRTQFLPGGHPPAVGSVWRQPELASTLERIAAEGRSEFYRGETAQLLVDEMARGGGLITHDDLRTYEAVWRPAIETTYRGHRIYSMPPSSSGGVTVAAILNIMEGFGDLPAFGSAALIHLETEAMRRAFMDRNHYLGDADFVDVPLARLISKEHAAAQRATIEQAHATPTPRDVPIYLESIQTTHYSIVDAEGNAASVTTTINSGFGNKVTVTGAGFLLNNEMDDFTSAPGEPNIYGLIQGEANAIAPGKRMLSAMAPTIVLDPSGELFLVLGSPGGPRIITSVYHVISNVIDHGMSMEDAVAAPRIHHQALPDTIRFEPGSAHPSIVDELTRIGHAIRVHSEYSGEVLAIIQSGNGWTGVADRRRGGAARGY